MHPFQARSGFGPKRREMTPSQVSRRSTAVIRAASTQCHWPASAHAKPILALGCLGAHAGLAGERLGSRSSVEVGHDPLTASGRSRVPGMADPAAKGRLAAHRLVSARHAPAVIAANARRRAAGQPRLPHARGCRNRNRDHRGKPPISGAGASGVIGAADPWPMIARPHPPSTANTADQSPSPTHT